MKKRLMIFCSLISLLLVGFQFPIYAEEDPSDTPSSVPVPNSIRLDQYFFDNYDLLPYIEANGSQYIDTGILAKSELRIDLSVSDLHNINDSNYIFSGKDQTRVNDLSLSYYDSNSNFRFYFYNANQAFIFELNDFQMLNIRSDKNDIYFNNNLISSLAYNPFVSSKSIYIFAPNTSNPLLYAADFKLYNFRIYDYDSESYVRYYYPAKSKAGGVIGLYDAVSDTFVTTSGTVPFDSPVDDQVLNLQIGTFLTAGLGWIGDILEFAVETPIIMIFMAIGLAGAMFRWGRRLVHF